MPVHDVVRRRGYRVVALEPGEAMGAIARKKLEAYPQVEIAPSRFADWAGDRLARATADAFAGELGTFGWVLALPEPERTQLLERTRELVRRQPRGVVWRHDGNVLYLARRPA